MSTFVNAPAFPREEQSSSSLSPVNAATPLLREVPRLLEYRSEADPDAEFIPKTIGGFVFGAMVFGFCINFGDAIFGHFGGIPRDHLVSEMLTRGALMFGITSVASSLMLVGLKVRADHSAVDLFARHWLNSICTGAIYALLIWGPWVLVEYHLATATNRFIAAAILMAIMAFPIFSAKWTIGPAPHPTN